MHFGLTQALEQSGFDGIFQDLVGYGNDSGGFDATPAARAE